MNGNIAVINVIFQCSFIPKFHISIHSKYENDNGSSENVGFFSIKLNSNILLIFFLVFESCSRDFM